MVSVILINFFRYFCSLYYAYQHFLCNLIIYCLPVIYERQRPLSVVALSAIISGVLLKAKGSELHNIGTLLDSLLKSPAYAITERLLAARCQIKLPGLHHLIFHEQQLQWNLNSLKSRLFNLIACIKVAAIFKPRIYHEIFCTCADTQVLLFFTPPL